MAKCAFHSEREAVEKCIVCGKEMCVHCTPKFINERVMCPVCSKENIKKERKGYVWISALIGFGILLAAAVIALLAIMIVRDGDKNFYRNVIVLFAVAAIMVFAIFMLIKSIQALKYYGERYKIALSYEEKAQTTTSAEPKEEAIVSTTTNKASKKATPKKATTTANKSEAKATEKKPTTAKVATKTAAKSAQVKTADVKKTTTSTTKTVKPATSKKATTTAKKEEVKPVEKKAITTAKKPTTAKKAAAKKSTTK